MMTKYLKKKGYCKECNKYNTIVAKEMCQVCWEYFNKGGQIYELPEKGEIKYDPDGKVICHICGRSFTKLGSHIYSFHKITRLDYCKQFSLDKKKGICSESHKEHLRSKVQEKCITDNLIEKGVNSRFKKGHKGRTKDKVSLQTLKRLQTKKNYGME